MDEFLRPPFAAGRRPFARAPITKKRRSSCSAETARWIGARAPTRIGKRKNVFDGLPYALYLPTGNEAVFTAETACEIAECRAPSEARLQPKLITPSDVVSGLRGGGNASRQIVDIITPAFPADKLMVIEVYTPGGNWSSYPPHKHDVHNPPAEVDLDEIYYYRIRQPEGFAMQHLYSGKHGAGSNPESSKMAIPCWCTAAIIR